MLAATLGGATSFAGEFVPLGDLPGGAFFSRPFGISADGTTVVGESNSADGLEAFRWQAGTGMVGLGDLPGGGFSSGAAAVSADGSVVAGSSSSALGREAYRWTAATGLVNLGDLPGGLVSGLGQGMSADGSVIVGTSNSEIGSEGYLWTSATGMVPLGSLSGGRMRGSASRVSDDGRVVIGQVRLPASSEAYRWTAETGYVPLGELPGGPDFSVALAVSPEGSAVAGWSYTGWNFDTDVEALLWMKETGLIGLGRPPGLASTVAWGVTGSGFVVAGSGSFLDEPGWVWAAQHGMRNLQDVATPVVGAALAGWQLEAVRNLRQTGKVFSFIGHGLNPDGNREAWLLRLTAEELGLAPERLVEDLVARTLARITHPGVAQSLVSKLETAIAAFDDGNAANDASAIGALQAFVQSVNAQRGKKIAADDADALITAANDVLAMYADGP